jgi:lipopolysaccharide transport system ATP-binding protein
VEAAVAIHGLGKCFRIHQADRPLSLKEAIFRGMRGVFPTETFWALRHINLEVQPGSIAGLIGHNGAGKSTLLRMIGGIGRPNEGSVTVRGRIAGLLDLGAGFHPDLSGRENVFVNGVIGGLTRSEVRERFEAIVEFAELSAFIDRPLRTYSAGMQQRLGFAVATHTNADVLLVDEMLAMGDQHFNRKCLDRIVEFRRRGCCIVLASHSLSLVRKLCDQAVQLRHGGMVACGPPEAVVAAYEREDRAELADTRHASVLSEIQPKQASR